MTNKEKIDGLMSDISELGGLIAGMRDIEICPLAFFSQTFDLAYKIIRDLHMLEGLQIDVFQKQMKGYQEIIESTILLQETVAEPFELPIVTIPAAEKQAVAVSLNDSIEKKNLLDFRKAFSLNDHFYFRKELFSDDEAKMNKVINDLNGLHSYEVSVAYLNESQSWDMKNAVVVQFLALLEKRFR